MAAFEPWIIAICVLGGSLFLCLILKAVLTVWAANEYIRIKNSSKTSCDIDKFVGPKNPVSPLKVVFAHKFQLGNRQASQDPIPLELVDSQHVPVRIAKQDCRDHSCSHHVLTRVIMTKPYRVLKLVARLVRQRPRTTEM